MKSKYLPPRQLSLSSIQFRNGVQNPAPTCIPAPIHFSPESFFLVFYLHLEENMRFNVLILENSLVRGKNVD